MRFILCAGFINGLLFMGGLTSLVSDRVPLFIGVLLMVMSAFSFGLLLGEEE